MVKNDEKKEGNYLKFERKFTKDGEDVYSTPVRRTDAIIKDIDENIIFQQKDIEVPVDWSDQAVGIIASKYFKDKIDNKGNREYSARQLVSRVVDTITEQGIKQGYLDDKNSEIFRDELAYLMLHQYASFNSPVWFNVGLYEKYGIKEKKSDEKFHFAYDFENDSFTDEIDIYERPQVSACFISSLKDNMGSIMDTSKREAMLFKWGSGNGVNFRLRGYCEPLSKGGVASGVMYFMIGFDHWAKIIKSGGKTRRAAKMVIMDIDHPDIYRFIRWKGNEELKAKALGIFKKYGPINDSDLDDEAHFSVSGQNSNNSVRMNDAFMIAYQEDSDWDLNFITARNSNLEEKVMSLEDYIDDRYFPDKEFITGLTNKKKITKALTLMNIIAEEAKKTGDPGVQFDDTINEWHTCPNSGRINASNPCSEYMFLDDSACNLASMNLTKFLKEDGNFNVEDFKHATRLMITAQEILVDFASYPGPDKSIAKNSHDFRALGLGYANLGALLMKKGIAYDSDEARALASSITSLLTSSAYNQSADIAKIKGAFNKFNDNKEPFMKVMKKHRDATYRIQNKLKEKEILESAKKEWDEVLRQKSFRNSQTTLLAPTGTIGFMMDVNTTGIESLLGLITYKNLSGGGRLELANKCFEDCLRTLNYRDSEIEEIVNYITAKGKDEKGKSYLLHPEIGEETPNIKKEHRKIFATSLGIDNKISYYGHIDMMAAVQPFLSGGISKTVNMPKDSSIEDIKNVYIEAWKKGLKSIALFVDESKGKVQPLQVGQKIKADSLKWGERKRLPDDIDNYKVRVRVNGSPIHIHFGEDPETGMSLEFFASFGGAGSDYSNVYDSFFKAMSRAVQYGQPLEKLVKDHIGAVGAIRGFTDHKYIKSCTSIEDLWAKLVAGHYLEDTTTWQVQPNPQTLRINILKRRKKFEQVEKLIHPEYFDENIKSDENIETIEEIKKDKQPEFVSFSGRICTNCGAVMVRSGTNCFKCENCYADTGCG